ncbi:MAG TPA: MFS transporter [Rhizomicrobium sp.]|jgi:MFS family permease|nr:MFS transporter [Rhizomicrobium sp.]
MNPTEAAAPHATGFSAWRGYRHYVLAVVTLVYVINYLDRQILNILLPLIQKEFHLTDAALGFLSGTVFAVMYAVLGVPLAIFADRMNRRNIIAGSLALFSAMTVFCGLAAQFWHLLLARLGTGVGEAGTGPSINSLIADYYPPERRATALSFYSAGLNIGLLIAFFGGGWIAQKYGWRPAFLVAGVPGLIVTFLVLFTVREPTRGQADNIADTGATPHILDVIKLLWSCRSFRWISLGAALNAFGGYAAVAFLPLFLTVSHHLQPLYIGIALALLTGIPGAIGTFMSGVFSDRFARRDPGHIMVPPMIGVLIAVPFQPIVYLSPNLAIALAAAIVPALMGAIYVGPGLAATQALVPLRMRAQAVALFLFVLNIIGLGLGPLVTGKISDLLKPTLGSDSLRWALMTSVISGSMAAFCYWRSTKSLKNDIQRGQSAT